jgi:hypothetical protein
LGAGHFIEHIWCGIVVVVVVENMPRVTPPSPDEVIVLVRHPVGNPKRKV